MPLWLSKRGVVRVVWIVFAVVLTINILTGISVICLVADRHPRQLTSYKPRVEDLKRSLTYVYQETRTSYAKSTSRTNQDTLEAKPSLEFLSLLKPVAHLSGLDYDREETENGQEVTNVRNWAVSEGSERNLMYNGITYENGSFIIPATGLYFVYSHVKFYVEDNKKGSKQTTFHQELIRYNAMDMTEEKLLSNQVTECKEGINDGAHLEYPSDIRGAVQLNAGDQLIVKVSNFSLLKHDRDWHYFGIYMV